MKQPSKWRETIDPFSIKYKEFKLLKVIGYPYAGNDVFYVKGMYKEKVIFCFLKVQRQKDGNIENEIDIINKIDISIKPQIIEYGIENIKYIITNEIKGDKLSLIVGDNNDKESLLYMKEFGKWLAKIHILKGDFKEVSDRKFFHVPNKEYFEEIDLIDVYKYLIENKPETINQCFCHGDFHYANIIWENQHMSGILDFELSGIGNKEFDIAWAIIRRPNQKFMDTEDEITEFIKGYTSIGECNLRYIRYYMTLIYSYFYSIGKKDLEYVDFVRCWLKKNIQAEEIKNDFKC